MSRIRVIEIIRRGPRGAPGDMDPAEWDALQEEIDAKLPIADVLNEPDMATGATDKPPSQASVVEYVGGELDGKVDDDDPRLPQHDPLEETLIAGVTDADGKRTWLEARRSDGGPTDWAVEHLVNRLGTVRDNDVNDWLAVLFDANGIMTDLAIRRSDGQFADFVLDRWATRLASRIGGGGQGITAGDYYVRGAEVLPAKVDTTTMIGWGSSSMAGLDDALTLRLSPRGITYVDGGKGGEWSMQTAARQGALPALLTFPDDEIPASGAAEVVVSNFISYNVVTSAERTNHENLRPYSGTVAGVHGTLAYNAVSEVLEFTRTEAGSVVSVAPDTPLIPDLGMANRSSMALLWAGKNDLYGAIGEVEDVIANVDAMFDWSAPIFPRTLVLGHFNNGGTAEPDEFRRVRIDAANAAHAARYGPLFVDVAAWLASDDVWTQTGITPDATDLAEQAAGNLAPSLSEGGPNYNHFNGTTNQAFVDYVLVPKLTELGWIPEAS